MFNNKKDPLVDAVKSIMEASAREREIERKLNESLGITSKKALPHELHKEYEKALSEAKKYGMEEEKELSPKQKKLAAKAGDKDEIEAVDLKALRKDKTLDEAKATEAQKEKVAKVMHKWKQGKEHIGKSDKTVPVTKKGQKQAVAIALSQAGLSKKMDESVEAIHEEIRTAIMEKLNHIYENEGVDAANAYFETLSEEERGILGENWWNRSSQAFSISGRNVYNKMNPTKNNYGAFGEPPTASTPPVTPRTIPTPQTTSPVSAKLSAMNTPGATVAGRPVLGGKEETPATLSKPSPIPAQSDREEDQTSTAPTTATAAPAPAAPAAPAARPTMARPAPTPRPARPAPTSDWKKDVFDSTKIGGA